MSVATLTSRRVTPTGVLLARADQDREEWLRLRQGGLGGSDALAVAGLDPWRSRLEVYLDKIGQAPPRDVSDAMDWGNRLEPVIADWFSERTGIRVRRCGLLANVDRPWQRVSVDRLTSDGGLLEIKTTSPWRASEWDAGQVADGAEVQSQHGLAVTGLPHAWVAVLIGGSRPELRRVERDERLITDLTALEAEFWQMVQDRTPPAIGGSAADADLLKRLYPTSSGRQVRITTETFAALLAYRDAQQKAVELKARMVAARNVITGALGDADAGLVDGRDKPVVTWRNTGKFDDSRFTAEHPDLAEKCTHTVVRDELDVAAIEANHPDEYRACRSRRLLLSKDI